jgi:hypothetical protein
MKLVDCLIKVTKPANQVLALFITITLTIAMTYAPFKKFNTIDPATSLEPLTPQMIWKEGGYPPVEVDVGLNISNFREFDIIKNQFVVDGILWFEFNPTKVGLETIEKFVCTNGTILQKSEPKVRLLGNLLFVKYSVRIQFVSKIAYDRFPFDDHVLYIAISNYDLSPTSVMFKGKLSGFTISKDIFISGWQWLDKDVQFGYERKQLDQKDTNRALLHPKVIFSLDFQRSGLIEILLIFLPLFLVTFIGLFAFAFDPKEQARQAITIASAMITALLGYKFVIQNISPKTGSFMFSDHIFVLLLSFAFITFIVSMIYSLLPRITRSMLVLRSLLFLSFHLIFLGWWCYLLYGWL